MESFGRHVTNGSEPQVIDHSIAPSFGLNGMKIENKSIGHSIHDLAKKLWPFNRSITGNGVRQTLREIKKELPELEIHEVPSGTKVFDWTIPDEWNVYEAWIKGPDGEKIVDFKDHNLHLVGYSIPINTIITLEELEKHLHSIPSMPEAIPYVTSYYSPYWGFCLKHSVRKNLKKGDYEVFIDSSLSKGSLTYGELLIKGSTPKEIFLSTYICHPSMGNNELSGPCVVTFLAKWILSLPNRQFSYRIIFIPETIGSITYLSRNLNHLKEHVYAGFNITCIGDDRNYSYLPSRFGNTLSDRVAIHTLKHLAPRFKHFSFLDRGSDERQYCSPKIDLPIVSIMRTKYGEYPEYHTSLDDLSLITPKGLDGGFLVLKNIINILENNVFPVTNVLCEPQLGKRGLYSSLGSSSKNNSERMLLNLMAYSDGTHSLLDIAELIGVPMWELIPLYLKLKDFDLLKELKNRI